MSFYCVQSEEHLHNNHGVQHLDIAPVRWMNYLGKGEGLNNTDFII